MKSMHWLVAAVAFTCLPFGVETASAQVQAQVRVNPNSNWRMWNRTPWFGNANVRRQLKIDDDQYRRLNEGYVQYWTPYNQGLTTLSTDLNEQQRRQREAELYGTFNNGFTKTTTEVFTDPQLRQRYNQLHWQYQGYNAFNDPAVQEKLRLTDEQRAAFNRYNNEWNQQMSTYSQEYATNRDAVTKQWPTTWKQARERINTTLTPEQRTTWSTMIGEPYEFPAEVYFHGGADGR